MVRYRIKSRSLAVWGTALQSLGVILGLISIALGIFAITRHSVDLMHWEYWYTLVVGVIIIALIIVLNVRRR